MLKRTKRALALLLCVVMLLPCLFACSNSEDEYTGPYITMYLSDDIYNFDPQAAYYNSDAMNVIAMLFDTLFKLDANGKVQKSMAKSYEFGTDTTTGEKTLTININDCYWSNGTKINSDDVIYSWERLLDVHNNYEGAALLFDIKNARAIKQGDQSISTLGVDALTPTSVRIIFEGDVDENQFLLNLTSLATAPLNQSYVEKDSDWAKKSSTMISSGPFKLGKTNYKYLYEEDGKTALTYIDDYALDKDGNMKPGGAKSPLKVINYFYLERNVHYYRDEERDALYSSVNPYRIAVDCSMTDEQILEEYKNGHIFYLGSLPLSIRNDALIQENAKVSDALSTFALFLNQDTVFNDGTEGGTKLFAIKEVREALSVAIDREKIRETIVYGKAATALIPAGLFEAGSSSTDFREKGGNLISTSADLNKAKELLGSVKIGDAALDPSKYEFTIKVASYDDVHIAMVNMIAETWQSLGFKVNVEKTVTIENNDVLKALASSKSNDTPKDICDDVFVESAQRGKYEVIAYDYVALSVDPYSMLANFAKAFSGRAIDMENEIYDLVPHRTGYDSDEYNALMEAIFFVPYFASLDREKDWEIFNIYKVTDEVSKVDEAASKAKFQKAYDTVKAVYEKYSITPTDSASKWQEQKAQLLHEAEKILMNDLPVIPVIFNQNAVLISDQLTKAETAYYIPYTFRKSDIKDYKDKYTTTDETGNISTIFDDFPTIAW